MFLPSQQLLAIKQKLDKVIRMQNLKLSIIMPLYNVEKTIRLALESVLMQKVNFAYEIIAVDDASTDNTLNILKDFAKTYPQIKIIEHKENQGNAIAFYNALCAADGDYFCVLDGDDYYTVQNKLQKQVDFLDNDKDCKYAAVTHKYLRTNADYEIFNDPQLFRGEQNWSYLDFLKQTFYSHTATYMYRNLFRGHVPEKFKEPLYRGDNPRTFMHLIYSKGHVKQLNFVGSVYFFDGNGIWSQTTPQAQQERNIKMLEELGTNLSSDLEQQLWNRVIEYRKLIRKNSRNVQQQYLDTDHFLERLRTMANKYAFKHRDFIFQQVYKSEFIDSFCESIGFIEMIKRGYTPQKTVTPNTQNIMISVSNLTTTGGGVYNEIKDIVSMYKDYNVYILWTDVDTPDKLDSVVKQQLEAFKNLTCVYGQSDTKNKLSNLCDKIIQIAPAKIYHYCGHNNVYLAALIQSMMSKNICVFSFDHGFSLGLDNTNYNTYITKRPMDYEILANKYHEKVIFMPDVLSQYFTTETAFKTPETISFFDNKLIDVSQINDLLNIEISKEQLQIADKTSIKIIRKFAPAPKSKLGKFFRHLGIKQRYKEFFYGLLLVLAQIPIIDLMIRSNKRQKLLKKILKYYR